MNQSGTKAERLLKSSIFFIDQCLGRQVGLDLRAVDLKVELSQDHFPDGTTDEDWIREVGRRGWVAFTKDKAIKRKSCERQAVVNANIAMFTLTNGNLNSQQMSELFISNLPRIARHLKKYSPPFIARVSSNGIDSVDLQDENLGIVQSRHGTSK